METESIPSPHPEPAHRVDRIGSIAAIAAALMIVLVAVVLTVQVQVTDAEVAATRGCGSVFDTLVDRSGWELWWASDLDETDEVRSALVRTTRCPDAVNRLGAIAAVLGVIGVGLAVLAISRTKADRSAGAPELPIGRRVARIGRLTAALGGALTGLGITAIVILVADADSTLFLYTDRLVVAIVGLVVLIPTVTLFVIGRVLVLLGENVQPSERDRPDA